MSEITGTPYLSPNPTGYVNRVRTIPVPEEPEPPGDPEPLPDPLEDDDGK